MFKGKIIYSNYINSLFSWLGWIPTGCYMFLMSFKPIACQRLMLVLSTAYPCVKNPLIWGRRFWQPQPETRFLSNPPERERERPSTATRWFWDPVIFSTPWHTHSLLAHVSPKFPPIFSEKSTGIAEIQGTIGQGCGAQYRLSFPNPPQTSLLLVGWWNQNFRNTWFFQISFGCLM